MVPPLEYKQEIPRVKLSEMVMENFHEKTIIYTILILIFVGLVVAIFFISFVIAALLTFLVYLVLVIEEVDVRESVMFGVGFGAGTLVVFLCLIGVLLSVTAWYLLKHGFASFSMGPSPVSKKVKKRLLKRNPKDPHRHEKFLRCMLISDTHSNHHEIPLQSNALKSGEIDVLICSGDYTYRGTYTETEEFCLWIKSLARFFSHIVIVPGNHDLTADKEFYDRHWRKWHEKEGKQDGKAIEHLIRHSLDDSPHDCMVHYLVDDYVIIDGVKFYGSPWQPTLMGEDMAFSRPESELEEYWESIPVDTNVLITHGPPRGILDTMMFTKFRGVGDISLRREVIHRVRPEYHVFGHVHERYGVKFGRKDAEGITFINGSSTDMVYNALHPPIIFDVTITGVPH
mmetsp:Transcript_637/g.2232  ORF Transcript_637/g.2232 Transcript_637/m.2232 type:complete len:399 (-) Transcript_637:2624-3820(-)